MQKIVLIIFLIAHTSCVHFSASKVASSTTSLKFYDQTLLAEEIPRWLDVKKSVGPYLEFWKNHGASLGILPISVVIEPPSSMEKSEILSTLYGDEFLQSLKILQSNIDKAQTHSEISILLQKFSCKYPPVFGNLSLKHLKLPQTSVAKFKKELAQEIRNFSDSEGKINGLSTASAYYAKFPEGGCQVIVLGRSDSPLEKPHAFFQRDVLFHELAHSFQLSLWNINSSEKIVSSESLPLEEAVADLFAHIYLDDPCHDRSMDGLIDTENDFVCGRSMDKHTLPIWDHVWSSSLSHFNNDALRHFLWLQFKEVSLTTFAKKFVAEIAKMKTTVTADPLTFVGLLSTNETRDIFKSEYLRIKRDSLLMINLMTSFCQDQSRPSCSKLKDFTGDEPSLALKGLLDHAPTTIGTSARKIAVGQKTYNVQFVNLPGKKALYLRINNQGKIFNIRPKGVTLETDQKVVWAHYPAPGSNFSWGSNGQLKIEKSTQSYMDSLDLGALEEEY